MLSAQDKEAGRVWIAGCIHNPKSREYQCVHCKGEVYHVDAHLRSGQEQVTEHFRHGKRATHALRNRSAMQGKALEFIVEQLSEEPEIELHTDQIYATSRGDLVTDILAREHLPGGTFTDTVIQVEDNAFNYNNYLALERALTRQGVYAMNILCAQGKNNPEGHFYRDEYRRATGVTVKNLGKNEKALYERTGVNIYFDADNRSINLVRFQPYEEVLPSDIISSSGVTIKEAGEVQTFELKKIPEIVRCISGKFAFFKKENGSGQFAFPRNLNIKDYFQKEIVAKERHADPSVWYDISERIGIILENTPEDKLRELTHLYGAERMGAFAVL